jgi:hypothetical protein
MALTARFGPTSMRKPLSRPERDDHGTSQTSIYERAFVKRGRCGFCVAGLPHIPLAVGFGRSGPSQTYPRTNGRATRNTSSEPEAEGEVFSLHAGSIRCGSRHDVIRSTIYSGSPGLPDVATQPGSKGRHHSFGRESAMGPLSGCLSGSSTWSSRPPAFARRVARSREGILVRLLFR